MISASKLSVAWRKSSYSTNGGNCVEVGQGISHAVPVRDSKDPHGPALIFEPSAFATFVCAIQRGELRAF
ncbi:DUF397 domain-containing protein [Streptomyces sp. NPDC097617]|uniref:DUF397 domain-containing protein n=1 Tax=Streptomyces sp. NPDC097617 TaxID=3366091 RepID=UPI0037FF5FBC